MKDLIRKVLREEVNRKFTKGTPEIQSFIIKQAERLINDSQHQTIKPEDNYGNYGEEWCKGGIAQFGVNYYFDRDYEDDNAGLGETKFFGARLNVNREFVDFLTKMLQLRERFVLNTLEEWYDEKYATKFGNEIGHPEFEIDEVDIMDYDSKCRVKVNQNLSREEMMDYIDNFSAMSRKNIESKNDDELKSTYETVYNIQLNN